MDSNLARKISEDSPERLWFVARGSVLKGPFTTSQLRDKIQKRELSFLDFCWRQGFNEWRPVGSVDDFDRRSKFRRLPHYPLVEVPASSTGGIYLKDTSPPEEEVVPRKAFSRGNPVRKFEDPKKKNIPVAGEKREKEGTHFEVSFARHKRHSISHFEYAAAVIFAVIFAYFVADYGMKEVAKGVRQNLAILLAGSAQKRGVVEPLQVRPEFWAPLYSAPSFDQVLPLAEGFNAGLSAPVKLPVLLEGNVTESAGDKSWGVGSFGVHSEFKEPLWSTDAEGIDPIYIRPLQVRGFLNLQNAQEVIFEQVGEPYRLRLSR